jgi:acyl-CoA synthetase (AMP-forming)/AMP-acid ligase II
MTSNQSGGPYLHTADVLEAISAAIPDAAAIVWRDQRLSWRDFEGRAARLARAFTDAGLTTGSSVALYLHNSPAYLEAYLGVLKMRGIPFGANYRYAADELHYLLDNADAEAIVYDESLAERVAAVAHRLPNLKLLIEVGSSGAVPRSVSLEQAIAAHAPMAPIERDPFDLIMTYTGGTTGMPKGVRTMIGRQARGLMFITGEALGVKVPDTAQEAGANARALRDAGTAPVGIAIPPFMHATGMVYGAMTPLLAGGTVAMPPSRSFNAAETLKLAQDERAACMAVAGEVIGRPLADEADRAAAAGTPYDLSSLKAVFSGGMIWTAESKRALLRHAPQAVLMDVAGSTEGHVGTSFATIDHVPDTGVFTPLATTMVLTEDGRRVQPGSGERGVLACAGPILSLGYHKDPEKSARTFRQIDGMTYAIAGDWATIDADGSIRLLGRDSSVINTGGEKVFAEEVEEVIMKMPQVADCIVVGLPDPRWGQIVGAVISPRPGATVDAEAVQAWIRGRLADYKAPRRVAFTATPPRAPNGKVNLPAARELLDGPAPIRAAKAAS